MKDASPFPMVRSDDPRYHDPRFQRRVIGSYRPIPFIENMHDVTLECGHAPLMFGTPDPQLGDLMFCPNCWEEQSHD